MGNIPPQKHYYVHGQEFDLRRWYDIGERSISLRIVLSLPIPERRAIVKYVGLEKLFYNSKPKLISKTKRGNELFKIRIQGTRPHHESYWLRYKCPSTDKIYISGIIPSFVTSSIDIQILYLLERSSNFPWLADAAMAWKLGLHLSEYYSITEEA